MHHAVLRIRSLASAVAFVSIAMIALASPAAHAQQGKDITLRLERDNTVVAESCTVETPAFALADADGNGVIQIKGRADGARIVVDLGGNMLLGGVGTPERLTGIGIAITGRNVTLRHGRLKGFKVAISAQDCDGLVLEDLDTSDNYAQLLRSTPWAEDEADWLFPHKNDNDEWAKQHGAGISVSRAKGVSIHNIFTRHTQNGILLDRVTDSQVYDNDCSFLSGWGLAMWRSSGNAVCRNSFDFCLRGYSHGKYNRGQDSAGILMFEQCSDNMIALNSATHCGDGIFGFAGNEALGETPSPSSKIDLDQNGKEKDPGARYRGRGCNGNRFIGNDLSFAAAHGLEMTFSFGNVIARNKFDSNAICGIWGGYARETVIVGNQFNSNGRLMTGSERGAINMEHAQRCVVANNNFKRDIVGVAIWSDEDAGIAKLPWAKANGMNASANRIVGNRLIDCDTGILLTGAKDTILAGNTLEGEGKLLEEKDTAGTVQKDAAPERDGPSDADFDAMLAKLPGTRKAVGARENLRGRDHNVVLNYGPYEWLKPIVVRITPSQHEGRFQAYGFPARLDGVSVVGNGPIMAGMDFGTGMSMVTANIRGYPAPYYLQVRDVFHNEARVLAIAASADWETKVFALDSADKKLDAVPSLEAFHALAEAEPRMSVVFEIDWNFGGNAPQATIDHPDIKQMTLPADRFGIVSKTKLNFQPGRWKVNIESDDGVRLLIDGKVAIDRWNIHKPTVDSYEWEVTERKDSVFELEYFENVGPARLRVWFDAIDPKVLGAN